MDSNINEVRERLEREASGFIGSGTAVCDAPDLRALLDHHAKLQAASSDVALAVDVAMAALEPWLDHGADEDAPQMACDALADAFRKAGLFTGAAAEAPAIDLEQYAVAVQYAINGLREAGGKTDNVVARKLEGLLALIDGQVRHG